MTERILRAVPMPLARLIFPYSWRKKRFEFEMELLEQAVKEGKVNSARERAITRWARRRWRLSPSQNGTARTDLAAFAALLLCMALVGAAIWAASGW